ncbi:MAG: ribokinase [bacterium]
MKHSEPRIVVVGSMVMDLVFRVERRPRHGETLAGEEFAMFLGGKGFNQALACHRLGARTTFVGRCGQDPFGEMFLDRLRVEGISDRFVTRDPEQGTGVAAPMVFPDGENSIIGVPRANARLAPEEVEAAEEKFAEADLVMLQFEVNPRASRRAAQLARRHGALVMLDPAPAHNAPGDLDWPYDYLVPNEIEADTLAPGETPDEWGRDLLGDARAVVISRGGRGAVVFDQQGKREFPGYRVEAVDTTGAGDAFRAGLAVELARGRGVDEAVRFANACGALACTVAGAEPSMPDRVAVERLMLEMPVPAGPVDTETALEEEDDID